MLFDATCPSCGARQRMNSMYAGTRRSCSSCGASFMLQLPETVRDSIEQNRPKPAPRTISYTCQDCLESFVPPLETVGDPHRTSGAIQCRRCGGRCAPAPEVRARLDASEKALLSALLTGAELQAATEQIVAPRWSAAIATRLRARCQRDLPFVRAHLWEAVLEGRLELRMAPPPICDLCALRPLADQRPLQASWRRVIEDNTKISPLSALTLFGGVAVLRRERTVQTLGALYFLCGECRRDLRRLFRTYRGYPADVGFQLDELREL